MIWRLREGLVEFVNQVAIRQCTGQLKYCYEYQAVQPSADVVLPWFLHFCLVSSQIFSKLAATHAKVHCILRGATLGLEWATCHHALDRSLRLTAPSNSFFDFSLGIYGGFQKIVGFPPKSSHFNRVFHYFHHPFWGYHHLRKPLYIVASRGHDLDNGSDLLHGWCSSRSCRNWQDRDCEGHRSFNVSTSESK